MTTGIRDFDNRFNEFSHYSMHYHLTGRPLKRYFPLPKMKLSETVHPTKPDIPSCMQAGALCAVTHSNGLLTPWSTTFFWRFPWTHRQDYGPDSECTKCDDRYSNNEQPYWITSSIFSKHTFPRQTLQKTTHLKPCISRRSFCWNILRKQKP